MPRETSRATPVRCSGWILIMASVQRYAGSSHTPSACPPYWEATMRFYTQEHRFYAGVDLHTRTLHLCTLDHTGAIVYDRNLPCRPDAFLRAVAPFRDGLVVGAACLFAWYWLADLCAREGIPFLIGHALYMKLIHGGKAKNDRIDAGKIARLLRGGNFPLAYAYPRACARRATCCA